MPSSSFHILISALIFLSTLLHSFPKTKSQECPYPCYPPPIGPGNNPPATSTPPVFTTPPATSTPPVFTTPPVSTNTPSAAGFTPYTPPSPEYFGMGPPPPEPIVPWFPYFYRKPPHQDQASSALASAALGGSTAIIVLLFTLLLF